MREMKDETQINIWKDIRLVVNIRRKIKGRLWIQELERGTVLMEGR